MIAIRFRFPKGRFHATAWGHSQFDGDPEWPPSVWRVVNAVVSTALTHGPGPADCVRLDRIVRVLCSSFPSVAVPPGASGRLRYYVPKPDNDRRIPLQKPNGDSPPASGTEKAPAALTLVADPFVSVSPDDAIVYEWPEACLENGDLEYLTRILRSIAYLGRAESVVAADMLCGDLDVPPANCLPGKDTQGGFGLMVVCPRLGSTLDDITQEFRDRGHAARGRRSPLPANGTSVFYRAQDRLLGTYIPVPSAPESAEPADLPTVAILALDGRVPFRIGDVEVLARAVRSALIRAHDGPSPDISGKDAHHQELRDQHRHLFVMPYDQDGDCRLDHVLLFEAGGMPGDVLAAIRRVTYIRNYEDYHAVTTSILLQGVGSTDLRCPLYAGAGVRSWRSITPFVPRRYARRKADGTVKDSIEDQINRELRARGFPSTTGIRVLGGSAGGAGGPSLAACYFRLDEKHGQARAPEVFVEITFEKPVVGPLAVGGHSHTGFGILVPQPETNHRNA